MHATDQEVSVLLALQQVDKALIKARKEFEELPQREQIRALRAKRAEVEKKREQALQLKQRCEAEVSKLEDEDARLVEKQHEVQKLIDDARGDFRNVESRTKELDGIAKRRAAIEEKLGAKADELDQIESVASQIAKALEVVAKQEEAATADFQKQGGALKAAVMQLETRRKELAGGVSESLAQAYERTAQRCGGVAVAVLDDAKCGACRMPIEPGRLVEIRRQAPLATCPHCKRMLVVAS